MFLDKRLMWPKECASYTNATAKQNTRANFLFERKRSLKHAGGNWGNVANWGAFQVKTSAKVYNSFFPRIGKSKDTYMHPSIQSESIHPSTNQLFKMMAQYKYYSKNKYPKKKGIHPSISIHATYVSIHTSQRIARIYTKKKDWWKLRETRWEKNEMFNWGWIANWMDNLQKKNRKCRD